MLLRLAIYISFLFLCHKLQLLALIVAVKTGTHRAYTALTGHRIQPRAQSTVETGHKAYAPNGTGHICEGPVINRRRILCQLCAK